RASGPSSIPSGSPTRRGSCCTPNSRYAAARFTAPTLRCFRRSPRSPPEIGERANQLRTSWHGSCRAIGIFSSDLYAGGGRDAVDRQHRGRHGLPSGRTDGARIMIGTVEIAGGGIAGLTTGLAFARKGWRVRVHEQDGDLRIVGAGIYIWENGLRVLDALGVLGRVTAGTIPASRHEKRSHDGRVFSESRLTGDF